MATNYKENKKADEKLNREEKSINDLQSKCMKLENQVEELSAKVKYYEELFRINQSKKYGTSSEKTGITTPVLKAKAPNAVIPNSFVSPSLIAFIMNRKYAEYIPLYRQQSALGKAIKYTLKQWEHLVAYLENGECELSNNKAERAVKSFVMGRKNFLFCKTPKGARASAVVYRRIRKIITLVKFYSRRM